MLFSVTPEQVKRLKPDDFVALLGRLLYAEASKAGVPMSGISVPLQITTPDGGEDGRFHCEWTGGQPFTSFLPSRFCVFQAKATKMGALKWQAELFTKGSKRFAVPELNGAVMSAVDKGGTYIGFSREDLGGIKIADIISKMREGLAKSSTSGVSLEIQIYDTNKIAEWVGLHPSVALWLIEKIDGAKLVGYMSIDAWAARSQFETTAYVPEVGERFSVMSGERAGGPSSLSAADTAKRIFSHLSASGRSFRLLGPSGLGKTRYITEIFRSADGTLPKILRASVVVCDYTEVATTLLQNANWFASRQSPTVLIVDECPAEIAQKLHTIAGHTDSLLRVLTVNLDDKPIDTAGFMCMKALPSSDQLIDAILGQLISKASADDLAYLRTFCAGFPKIAVILGSKYLADEPVLTSADEVITRILKGAEVTDREAIRALEGLSLFTALPPEAPHDAQFDHVAEALCDMSGNRLYEHLMVAARHDLVGQRDQKLFVQLEPVANHLAFDRLSVLRVTTLMNFIRSASSDTVLSLLHRLGRVAPSETAQNVVIKILNDETLAGWPEIDSYGGSQIIAALIEVSPEHLARHLHYSIAHATSDLSEAGSGRPRLVYALSKLVFPKSTFLSAAGALLELAAAEDGKDNGVATKAFGQIYQPFLSGTEVPPDGRWSVLEDAVQTRDMGKVAVVISALRQALSTSHIGRPGGTERLGRRPPLKDWNPKTWGDVWGYQGQALDFLMRIWREYPETRGRVEGAIGSSLRDLMVPAMIDKISSVADEIGASGGVWTIGYKKIGDWIYYDSRGVDPVFTKKVKSLHARLFPVDPIEQAVLFAKFWPADIRDPDALYTDRDQKPDYLYGTRRGREVGQNLSKDQILAEQAIARLMTLDLPNVSPVVTAIGETVENPMRILRQAVWLCANSGTRTAQAIVSALVSALNSRDSGLTEEALETAALASDSADWTQYLLSSVTPNAGWLNRVTSEVRGGKILPRYAGSLSYGQRLNMFTPSELVPLLDALRDTQTADGLWAVLEIVMMYRLSDTSGDTTLLTIAKPFLVAPELISGDREGRHDSHLFETLCLTVVQSLPLDVGFVRALTEQIMRLCQAPISRYHDLDQAARRLLPVLFDTDPVSTWEIVARFYELATSIERYMLGKLVVAGADVFERDLTTPGPLWKAHKLAEDWAQKAPSDRIGFVVSMYPMLQKVNDTWSWSPEFDAMSKAFGKVPEFRQAVERRIWEFTGGFKNEFGDALISALESWSGRSDLMLWTESLISTLKSQND